jgi:hypothetical protein
MDFGLMAALSAGTVPATPATVLMKKVRARVKQNAGGLAGVSKTTSVAKPAVRWVTSKGPLVGAVPVAMMDVDSMRVNAMRAMPPTAAPVDSSAPMDTDEPDVAVGAASTTTPNSATLQAALLEAPPPRGNQNAFPNLPHGWEATPAGARPLPPAPAKCVGRRTGRSPRIILRMCPSREENARAHATKFSKFIKAPTTETGTANAPAQPRHACPTADC